MPTRKHFSRRGESDRRHAFAQINASWVIEGQVMDATDLALHRSFVIQSAEGST